MHIYLFYSKAFQRINPSKNKKTVETWGSVLSYKKLQENNEMDQGYMTWSSE